MWVVASMRTTAACCGDDDIRILQQQPFQI